MKKNIRVTIFFLALLYTSHTRILAMQPEDDGWQLIERPAPGFPVPQMRPGYSQPIHATFTNYGYRLRRYLTSQPTDHQAARIEAPSQPSVARATDIIDANTQADWDEFWKDLKEVPWIMLQIMSGIIGDCTGNQHYRL